jgi:phosphatidylglycerol:prolipoprotein diacylglycerol transferase
MILAMILDTLQAAAADPGSAIHPPLQWVDLHLKRGIELGPLTSHFGFTLRYYSLAYLAGIIFGYWHLSRSIRTAGAPLAQHHADDLFFWCTIGIIVGGRTGYALFYDHEMLTSLSRFIRLWDGGMSFHGGLAGVILAIWWICRKNGLSFLRVGDYIAPCAPIGLFFGRCANFINGELWGRETTADIPWAMVFPDGGPLPRHPSQLYEALLEGVVLGLILIPLFWKSRARFRPGLLAGVFVGGYGVARFCVEYFREPDRQLEDFARATGMSMGQWLCVPMIVLGLVLVVRALRRPALGSGIPVPV